MSRIYVHLAELKSFYCWQCEFESEKDKYDTANQLNDWRIHKRWKMISHSVLCYVVVSHYAIQRSFASKRVCVYVCVYSIYVNKWKSTRIFFILVPYIHIYMVLNFYHVEHNKLNLARSLRMLSPKVVKLIIFWIVCRNL